jgi:hypothetical protein
LSTWSARSTAGSFAAQMENAEFKINKSSLLIEACKAKLTEAGMDGAALKMLFGDRAKYIGLIFGIAFSTMLMSNQVSIFAGLMLRTAGQILDAREADIWVMDRRVDYVDEIEP